MAIIEKSLPFTLENEGGYSNHPFDQPTNYGITQQTLAHWRGKPVSPDDVKNLSLVEATRIYQHWYWNTLSLNSVQNQNVATAIFDFGVNAGVTTSAKYTQTALNRPNRVVNVDGMLGPLTVRALNLEDPNTFITEFQKVVVQVYTDIVEKNPHDKVFLDGWLNRAKRLSTLLVPKVLVS